MSRLLFARCHSAVRYILIHIVGHLLKGRLSRLGRGDDDFYLIVRMVQLYLSGRTGWSRKASDPCVPCLIHFLEVIDIREPNLRHQQMVLVASSLFQQSIDLGKCSLRLQANAFPGAPIWPAK